jgi:hypothetical protein
MAWHKDSNFHTIFFHKGKYPTFKYVKNCTYIISCENYIKVGKTMSKKRTLLDRISSIQVDCPFPIKIYRITELPEKEVHLLLKKFHLHGEWFCFTDECKDIVNNLPQCNINVKT